MVWRIEPFNFRVEAELRALPGDVRVRLARISDILERLGPQGVGMPYVRPLGRKLWEIRFKGMTGAWRVLYSAVEDRRFVLLHVFAKKTRKTPEHEIDLALNRLRRVR